MKTYVIATAHLEYRDVRFPSGSVVIDPWRMIPPQEGVNVRSLGRNRPPLISLLVPSRGRPKGFAQMIESARATATYPEHMEIVCYLDIDDPGRFSYPNPHGRNQNGLRYLYGERIVLSAMWNACYDTAKGEILMHCGDDIRFLTDGWDVLVRDTFAAVGDKILFVYGDDLGPNGQIFGTHGFLHRRWVETVGYFVPPLFSSDWNDVWLNEVAQAIDRHQFLPMQMEHLHPYFGKGEYDLTHQEREARGTRDRVVELYESTRDQRLEDARKLKAVMA